MANLNIIRSEIGKVLTTDGVSGLLFFQTAPAKTGIFKITKIKDAVDLGFVGDYSDETPPDSANFTITGSASAGDYLEVLINNARLCYLEVSETLTADEVAAKVADLINGKKYIHGFSASASTATVTVNPKVGQGGLTVNLTTAQSASLTVSIDNDFTLGSASKTLRINKYISDYFRFASSALYLGVFAYGTFTNELEQVQDFANGIINQFGVIVEPEILTSALVDTFQAQAAVIEAKKAPAVVSLCANIDTLTVSSIPNFQNSVDNFINIFIGQNGALIADDWDSSKVYSFGQKINFLNKVFSAKLDNPGSPLLGGWLEVTDNFKSIPGSYGDIGVMLGILSKAAVHENVGWVGQYDVSNSAFLTGAVLDQNVTLMNTADFNTLEEKNITFFRTYPMQTGVFISDSWTAIQRNSDFATLENNRVFNKASRLITMNLNPLLNSPLYVTPTGALTKSTIAIFKNETEKGLEIMKTAGELSNYLVTIDPNQDVLTTGTISIGVKLQPVGVARTIDVTMTFVVKL